MVPLELTNLTVGLRNRIAVEVLVPEALCGVTATPKVELFRVKDPVASAVMDHQALYIQALPTVRTVANSSRSLEAQHEDQIVSLPTEPL